jgi:hypothetical protein
LAIDAPHNLSRRHSIGRAGRLRFSRWVRLPPSSPGFLHLPSRLRQLRHPPSTSGDLAFSQPASRDSEFRLPMPSMQHDNTEHRRLPNFFIETNNLLAWLPKSSSISLTLSRDTHRCPQVGRGADPVQLPCQIVQAFFSCRSKSTSASAPKGNSQSRVPVPDCRAEVLSRCQTY